MRKTSHSAEQSPFSPKLSTCTIESGKTGELALLAIDAAKVLNVFRIAQRTSILARF